MVGHTEKQTKFKLAAMSTDFFCSKDESCLDNAGEASLGESGNNVLSYLKQYLF